MTKNLNLEYTYSASLAKIWDAWTLPDQVAAWWGPDGFTTPTCELDVRPEGAIHIVMRDSNGTLYPMKGTYQEVAKPKRLVFETTPLDDQGNELFTTKQVVDFIEQGSKTLVTVRIEVIHETPEATPYLQGMEPGWQQNLARLAHYVES